MFLTGIDVIQYSKVANHNRCHVRFMVYDGAGYIYNIYSRILFIITGGYIYSRILIIVTVNQNRKKRKENIKLRNYTIITTNYTIITTRSSTLQQT